MIKSFKSKKIKVQDYPEPSYAITLYGESNHSIFKLNDEVVIINNDRVAYKKSIVIGFDEVGNAMLNNCAWCNTRGGYEDSSLVYYKDFEICVNKIANSVLQNNELKSEYSIKLYVSSNWSELKMLIA